MIPRRLDQFGGYPRDLVQNFPNLLGPSYKSSKYEKNRNSEQTHGSISIQNFILGLKPDQSLIMERTRWHLPWWDHHATELLWCLVCISQNYIIPTGHHLDRNTPQCPILVIKPCIEKDENLRDRHKFYTHIKKGCHGNCTWRYVFLNLSKFNIQNTFASPSKALYQEY